MLLATALALASAGLHAGWNLLVKTSTDRFVAAWGQFLFGGLLFAPVLVVVGLPEVGSVWPLLLASSLVHVGYVLALVGSYEAGDFSLAYPLARGTGALGAAVLGVALLGDDLRVSTWLAIAVVVLGLLSLAASDARGSTVRWAALTGLCISTYTVLDAAGARASDGLAYGIAVTCADGLALTVAGVALGRHRRFVAGLRSSWRRFLTGGACTTVAYTLVLIAVGHAPVGYVAVLRECSVILGAWAGWMLLGERLGRRRIASSAVVTGGLALLVVLG